MTTINECSPTISIDRSYGKDVSDFDVDTDAIVAYLRTRGMSDDDIKDLTIEFPSELPRDGEGIFSKTTSGRYISKDDKALVYFPQELDAFKDEEKAPSAFVLSQVEEEMTNTLIHELEHAILDGNTELAKETSRYMENKRDEYFGATKRERTRRMIAKVGIILAGIGAAANTAQQLELAPPSGLTMVSLGWVILAVDAAIQTRQFKKALQADDYERYVNSPEEQLVRRAAAAYDGKPPLSLSPKIKEDLMGQQTYDYTDILSKILNQETAR